MHHGMDGDRTLQTVEESYSQPLFSFPFSLPGRGFRGTVFTKEGAHEERMARVLEGRQGACGSGGQGKGRTECGPPAEQRWRPALNQTLWRSKRSAASGASRISPSARG